MVTQVPGGGLTPLEQALVETVERGEQVDLSSVDDRAVDEAAMRSWGYVRTCRASVIRSILTGELVHNPDPRGLRLRGARIVGRLDLNDVSTDLPLVLTYCFLEEGILARRARLASVALTRCQLENPSEPPLDGARLICSGLSLDHSRVIGHTQTGAVDLSGALIGGQFSCTGVELRNDHGPALIADSLTVTQEMYLDRFIAISGNDGVTVDLSDATVGGAFWFVPERLENRNDPHRRLAVDGLTYPGVPETSSYLGWLELLREGTPSYTAQPYSQLAAGYRAREDERRARQILISSRDDQFARTDRLWPERLWGRITKITVGYGFEPWRALLFGAAVVAVSLVFAVVLGSHGALAQTDKTTVPGRPCTILQQLSVGVDLNLPIGTGLAREDCALPKAPSTTAAWLTGVQLVLRGLVWAFAALFAFARAASLRKT